MYHVIVNYNMLCYITSYYIISYYSMLCQIIASLYHSLDHVIMLRRIISGPMRTWDRGGVGGPMCRQPRVDDRGPMFEMPDAMLQWAVVDIRIHIHCVYACVYIYIYIERERYIYVYM